MTDGHSLPTAIKNALLTGDEARLTSLGDDLEAVSPETRKSCLSTIESTAQRDAGTLERACPLLADLLADDRRSVRLVAAKTVARLATDHPTRIAPLTDVLTDALADDFYFVRGRAAEALGHVAETDPEAIDRPTVLARLLTALSVDRSEIRRHVAGALAGITFGEPAALRTMCDDCASHLDDEDPLVRYHLVTVLAVVASTHPSYAASTTPALRERLADDEPHVRGRAAEALGLLARADATAVDSVTGRLTDLTTAEDAFVATRARFALAVGDDPNADVPNVVGDPDAIAAASDDVVDAITSPPDDENCPNCGEAGVRGGPPFCPACGMPLPE